MRKVTAAWLTTAALLLTTSCGGMTGSEPPDGAGTADGPDVSPSATQTTAAPQDDAPGAGGGNGNGGTGSGDAASCEVTEDWTLDPDTAQGSSGDPISQVRTGRHDCFDRVVFDLDGTAETGFDVQYRSEVRQPGSGTPLPVAGGAALQVIVRSPVPGVPGISGGGEPLGTAGDHLVPESDLAAWDALRAVRYGGYFEGQTTFALGAREELPFRAFAQLDADNGVRKVVVDIAHTAH